mmetsp:Transcript_22357/g.33031  ORF Transcript_22357/g.33031 Transcript_22357/m.33031 type:complete len:124 (+) Transcript_22357:99-470(+)|eukprot:CAMPEP_0194215704 /NCGR_PEP_ID=MMETSP0156-20130528/17714_1 /TAXON_ID=33649 /ORGANISM="Thalassionema nitzschioides, Strain L26-B" /LENGTH=123 /DNA_ID=CAMNT_0038944299 /DNA_START=84 /DNA_END=455 /DNA_ORIENTATION=-
MSLSDYQERAQALGLAPQEEVERLLNQENNTVLLDVRTADEIATFGKMAQAIHIPCTATDASKLVAHVPEICSTKETPIIIYCRSGRRAATAKKALEESGYQEILNAGGYDDIKQIIINRHLD